MIKIALIDLVFHWPATGGSWVDIKEVAQRLHNRGYDIKLFIIDFDYFLPRGRIENHDLDFPIEKIPFDRKSFNCVDVPHDIKVRIDRFHPDGVIIADGYSLKPYVINAVSADYPVINRIYAYEMFCLRGDFWLPQEQQVCANHIFLDYRKCLSCFNTYIPFKGHGNRIYGQSQGDTAAGAWHELINAGAIVPKHYKNIFLKSIQNSHSIIVNNERIQKLYQSFHGDVRNFGSGVDPDQFSYSRKTESPDGCILFMPGRSTEHSKGFHVLKRAVDKIKSPRYKIWTTLSHHKGMISENMESLGWLSHHDMIQAYRHSDICVVPSVWDEPFGMTAVEAMSSGRPVVASHCGGLSRIVQHGRSGFLFPPGDDGALAQYLDALMEDPALRHSMGCQGRNIVERKFSWDVIVDQYEHIFDNIGFQRNNPACEAGVC